MEYKTMKKQYICPQTIQVNTSLQTYMIDPSKVEGNTGDGGIGSGDDDTGGDGDPDAKERLDEWGNLW